MGNIMGACTSANGNINQQFAMSRRHQFESSGISSKSTDSLGMNRRRLSGDLEGTRSSISSKSTDSMGLHRSRLSGDLEGARSRLAAKSTDSLGLHMARIS